MRVKFPLVLITLFCIAAPDSFSQISITQQDVLNTFPLNGTIQVHENFPFELLPIDIGQTGGPNIYDFSNLDVTLGVGLEVVLVSSIPLPNLPFSPNLTALVFDDIFVTAYTIFDIQPQQWLSLGFVGVELGGATFLEVRVPPQLVQPLPTSFGSQWSGSGQLVESVFVEGVLVEEETRQYFGSGKADGFGTLFLPGGLSFACLRIVEDVNSEFESSREFRYETKSGVVLLVDIPLTNMTPDTGTVMFEEILLLGPVSCCDTPGDANNDGKVNIADVVFVIDFLFRGGSAPACEAEGNANGDNKTNIADVSYVIAYVFAGGADPICVLR